MIRNNDHLDKIERALAFAYRIGPQGEVGPGWEDRLMTAVRAIGPLQYRYALADLFQRFVWRLAPVAALIILMLGTFLYYQTGFLTDGELARLLIDDRFDDALFQVLGRS